MSANVNDVRISSLSLTLRMRTCMAMLSILECAIIYPPLRHSRFQRLSSRPFFASQTKRSMTLTFPFLVKAATLAIPNCSAARPQLMVVVLRAPTARCSYSYTVRRSMARPRQTRNAQATYGDNRWHMVCASTSRRLDTRRVSHTRKPLEKP